MPQTPLVTTRVLLSAIRNPAWLVGALGGVLGLICLLFGGAGLPLETLSMALLLALASVGMVLVGPGSRSRWVNGLLGLGAAMLIWLLLGQLPAAWLGLNPHPYLETLAALGLTPSWGALALNGGQVWSDLLLLLAYGLTFAWLVRLAAAETVAAWLLRVVSIVGALFAFYGLWVFVMGNASVMWLPKTVYTDSLSASFISRNHAATMLGLGLVASLGLLLLRIGEISGQLPALQRLKALWLLVLRPGGLWAGLALVQWLALILTNSRAGFAVTVVAVVLLLGLLALARPAVRGWLLAGLGVLGALGLLLLAVLGNSLAERATRLDRDAGQEGGRAHINGLSWQAVSNSPVLGHGYGAWAAATAVVRSPDVDPAARNQFENGHNLYLQTLVELGWTGLLGLLALGGGVLAILLQGLMTRRRQVALPATALAALGLVGLHSAVDFPLHIPAVMLAFLCVLAAGVGQSFKDASEFIPARRGWRLGGAVLAMGGLLLSGWLAWVQWPAWQVEGMMRQLRGGGALTAVEMSEARTQLTQCAESAPWLAQCAEDLALVHLTRAGQLGLNTVGGQVLLRAAELQAVRALKLVPARPTIAYRLARIKTLQGDYETGRAYLTHSLLMGPYEPMLSRARTWMLLAFLNRGQLSPDDHALYQANLVGLWQQRPHVLWRLVRQEPQGPAILAEALAKAPGGPDLDQWQQVTRIPWPLGKAAAAQ